MLGFLKTAIAFVPGTDSLLESLLLETEMQSSLGFGQTTLLFPQLLQPAYASGSRPNGNVIFPGAWIGSAFWMHTELAVHRCIVGTCGRKTIQEKGSQA